VDINAIRDRLENHKSGVECYKLFKEIGLNYVSSFQGIEDLYYSEDEALSRITLTKNADYILQPGVLDSALQTSIGLNLGKNVSTLNIPFSVKEVNIYGEVSLTHWCHVQRIKNSKTNDKAVSYDIDLLSETGEVLLRFTHLLTLPKEGFQKISNKVNKEEASLHLYSNKWKETALEKEVESRERPQLIFLAGGSAKLAEQLTENLEEEVIAINEETEQDFFNKVLSLIQTKISKKERPDLMVLYRNTDYVHHGFISGLLKTAQLEQGQLIAKTIGVESLSLKELSTLCEIIEAEYSDVSKEVCYKGTSRLVRILTPIASNLLPNKKVNFKEGGVYLITG
jgi:polyketide synthase PksN